MREYDISLTAAFEAIKSSLQGAPILALPDEDRPFSVVCDASDFGIGCALLQVDAVGRERVVSFQSRQLKAAEKNCPVYDKEPLAMKYALVKFRVHLLGQKPFVIYADHASLRTATSSPHLSLRMARWLSFFAEYNFTVEYKPGKQNVLVDALSRRSDYELAHLAYLALPLYELIHEAYADDDDLAGLVEAQSDPNRAVELTARQRSRLHRYSVMEGLLYYQVDGGDEPQIVVPNDEYLRYRVLYEAHDTPLSGHLGREKVYTSVACHFWWSHMYKWVRKYVQTCETCPRVKAAPSASTPLMSLPVPTDCWRSVSRDFIFELPADAGGHTGILVFVCRLSKMVRLAAVRKSVTAPQAAQLFVDNVFRHHGLSEAFVSDRDPKFVSHFWQHLFRLLGTRAHQVEHASSTSGVCALQCGAFVHGLHSVLHERAAAPAYATDIATGFEFGWGEANTEDPRGPKGLRTSVKRNLLSFIETGEAVRQRVRDAMATAQDRQKENSDRHGRANTQVFQVGDQVLLNAKNLPISAVSVVGSTKLRPSFIGPFTVIGVHGHTYMLDLPSAMAKHPTFYVGLLKPYHPAAGIDPSGSDPSSIDGGHSPSLPAVPPSQEPGLGQIAQQDPLGGARRGPPRCQPVSIASGSNRDARIRSAALPRRFPRIAPVGTSPDPLDQGGPPVQANPAHGAAGDVSPQEHREQPQRGTRRSEDDHVVSPSPPAGNLEAVDSFPRPTAVHHDPRNMMQAGRHHAVPASDAERLDRPLHRALPPLLGTGGVPYFHVEKILRHRGRFGTYQYLVKWRSYPDSDSSWEPGSRLEEDCADLVAALEQVHGPGRR
ncbi:unnamed protein product [Phytophthora fragariaefolia]|uniref:Unnamed protein product n=1 Tax=Phytophthora fragariaefolia TaxID=1490495 RepID=A0A9W6XCI2_9STRA|nr:unnamed protein product [Phytophthora fragariaefolia]